MASFSSRYSYLRFERDALGTTTSLEKSANDTRNDVGGGSGHVVGKLHGRVFGKFGI